MSEVLCQVCGLPLPETRRWNQLYHAGACKKTAVHAINLASFYRRRWEKDIAKRYPHRRRDPLKLLHLDYAIAKLAELKRQNEAKP
jgi:hypothetical protein